MTLRFVFAGLALAVAMAAGAADVDRRQAKALHALFERQWEDSSRRFPEGSTYRGDLRYNDQLSDVSAGAIAAYDVQVLAWLAEARAVPRDQLGPTDRVSLDLFIGNMERQAQAQAFTGYRSMSLGALGGVQTGFADLLKSSPVSNRREVEQMLRRIEGYPRQMDQEIANLRRGLGLGWVASRNVLERVIAQIDVQLPADVTAGPYYAPFLALGTGIPQDERSTLQAQGRAAIERHIIPSMRKLRAFVVDEALPRAPADGGLRNYPGGDRVYEMLVRHQTTTSLSPEAIHATGQRELSRLRTEMEAVMRRTGFTGEFPQFVQYLNTDPKFFHSGPEALLAGYRDIAKRIDAELPRLFAELPRAPYGVRAMPQFRGPDAAEYYDGPDRDGRRAGYFNANTAGWRTRPTWRMATLTAHEAVPGHHLQIARATELRALPQFRRDADYTAFVEGWGVYAETLGREIGLYDDPHALFGHLQWQAFRAARLVVDTGIHRMGWTRQQAIDFMVERTGFERGFVTAEVDRYTSVPGQALGYMIGKLKIDELRDRAKARLGQRFDLRRFHNAVIDQGALPLDTLDKLIDEWIASQTGDKP
jgi:uncharacterized protein (DUF885 family)